MAPIRNAAVHCGGDRRSAQSVVIDNILQCLLTPVLHQRQPPLARQRQGQTTRVRLKVEKVLYLVRSEYREKQNLVAGLPFLSVTHSSQRPVHPLSVCVELLWLLGDGFLPFISRMVLFRHGRTLTTCLRFFKYLIPACFPSWYSRVFVVCVSCTNQDSKVDRNTIWLFEAPRVSCYSLMLPQTITPVRAA